MSGSIKMWLLAFIVTASVGFGALMGVGCVLHANVCWFSGSEREVSKTPPTAAEIYAARCALCHGTGAEGGQGGPSLITGDAASLSLLELISKIGKGRPFYGMPAFKLGSGKLSAAQIEAVAQYVTQLRGGAA